MRNKPTLEQAQRIHDILREVEVRHTDQYFSWGNQDNGKAARELCHQLTGYRPRRSDCFSCRVKVLDTLRDAVGLPPLSRPISPEKSQQRLEICHSCPAYHPTTQSCGRLLIDAISPKPVEIDGQWVNPCGCFLPLKTSVKQSSCPAHKW